MVLQQLEAESVQLIVTSPPYFDLKDTPWVSSNDFSTPIYVQYVDLLERAWRECFRVLDHGCKLIVNIADIFTSAQDYGKNVCIPLHAGVVQGARKVGFDLKNTIIWRKMATRRPSGGGRMMGSWPYPRKLLVAQDFEYILVFEKPGQSKRMPSMTEKKASGLRRADYDIYVDGLWTFPGARKNLHPAPFPEELAYRLTRMYSVVGDAVLDPFSGSGTTVYVATQLARQAIGIELDKGRNQVARARAERLRRLWEGRGSPGVCSADSNASRSGRTPGVIPRVDPRVDLGANPTGGG